jgi:Ca2+-binding RTX toxin-like protein
MSSPLIPSLDALRIELQALLQDLTQSGGGGQSFEQLLLQCFGSGYDRAKAATLRTAWSSGNGQQLPKLQLVSDGSLTGASAGFGATTNTIYLSTQFLLSASKQDRQAVLLEEIGHFIDYRINKTDTAGDEGALFSALARGIPLTATERAAIKAENDQAVVKINGISVAIEQALPSIFSPTTIRGSNLKTSGNLAAWSNQKGAFSTLSLYNDATGTTQIIASQAYGSQGFGNGNVALAGSSVVYAKFDGLDTEIYRYTLANGATPASTVKLTNNSFDDSAPQIQVVGSTTSIAWEGFDGVDVELFRNDNGVTRQLTNNSTDDQDLTLSGAVALWAGWDGNDWEIYSDNGSTTTKLTNNSTDDYSPVLDGNRVAWLGFNGTNENLFFNNGTTTTQITAGLVVEDPEISGNNLTYLTRSATDQLSLITRSISGATSKTLFTSPAAGSFYSSGNFSYEAAGNFIAWVEPGGSDSSGNLIDDKLKLYNATTGVSSTVSSKLANESFKLTPTELIYLEDIPGDGFFEGQLNAYNLTTGTKTQISATPPNGYPSNLDKAGNSYFAQGYKDITKYTPDTTKPLLTITGATVVEGLTIPQNATLTITLSQASSSNVSVSWKTQSYGDYISSLNQASDYSDYTRSSGIATFAPGQLSKTISVPILNDSYSEPDEVFYVQLSNPVGAALVPGQTFAEVVITDTLSAAVTTTLPADVENLLLTGSANINGTGNSTSNTITGNSGNNILDGGGGSFSSFTNYDIMIGGLGDDTYITSGFQATIQEQAGGGIDTVSSSYSFVSLGSFANVENLILTSLEFVSGSGSSEDNVITANNGNSNLDGQGGIDTASYASAASAVTVSLALPFTGQNTGGSGFDTLNNFENITGSNFNDSLTGSAIANVISGGLGADTLMGGDGNDTLIGGAGADVFRFDSTPNATTNRDSITGFSIAQGDKIQLENAVFTALTTPGTLAASAFLVGAAATNASQRILYNSTTGLLSYDLDGNGAGAAVPFATISTGIALTNSFFTVT